MRRRALLRAHRVDQREASRLRARLAVGLSVVALCGAVAFSLCAPELEVPPADIPELLASPAAALPELPPPPRAGTAAPAAAPPAAPQAPSLAPHPAARALAPLAPPLPLATPVEEPRASADDTGRDRGDATFALDRAGIQAAIREKKAEIRECYEGWLKQAPELGGRLEVSFRIARVPGQTLGAVDRVSLLDGGVGNLALEGCVLNVLHALRFEAPPGEPLTVTYPFVFRGRGDAG